MPLTKATYSMILGAQVNVLDFGAVGDGVTDDSVAIQAAFDYVDQTAFQTISSVNRAQVEVVFPSGYVFYVASQLTVGAYTTISGYGAWIKAAAGIYPIYGNPFRLKILGLSFTAGLGAIDLFNSNTNRTNPVIRDCRFEAQTGYAIRLQSGTNSCHLQIIDCSVDEALGLVDTYADYTTVTGGWIEAANGPVQGTNPVFYNRRGRLWMSDIVMVPGTRDGTTFHRWINNDLSGLVVCERVRFGGEDGGWCPVVNDAVFSSSVQTGVVLSECQIFSVLPSGTPVAIYLTNLPNLLVVRDCTGLTSAGAGVITDNGSIVYTDYDEPSARERIRVDVAINAFRDGLVALPYGLDLFIGSPTNTPNYYVKKLAVTSGASVDLFDALGAFFSITNNERYYIELDFFVYSNTAGNTGFTLAEKFVGAIYRGSSVYTSDFQSMGAALALGSTITTATITPAYDTATGVLSATCTNSGAVTMNVIVKARGLVDIQDGARTGAIVFVEQ